MINLQQFESIKLKYGKYCSWAVWAEVGDKPKSNIGDLSVLDVTMNPTLLEQLNTNIVMVGLNIARPFTESFRNFHDNQSSYAQDYKLRYAFRNSPFYGAYMTDVIKDLADKSSGNVKTILKQNPALVEENIVRFKQELIDIQAVNPLIIAFGNDAYNILLDNLPVGKYNIKKVMHYSHQISKENYRIEVAKSLGFKA